MLDRHIPLVKIETVDPVKSDERFASLCSSVKEQRLIALNIEISSVCNLACHYCAMHTTVNTQQLPVRTGETRRFGLMDLNLFQEVIDKCKTLTPIQVLYLHGMGEPLLHPHIDKVIAYARGSKIFRNIVLITNGVLLTPAVLNKLIQAGLDEIRVSYDVFTPESYTELKGKDHSHAVRKNIEECLEFLKKSNCSTVFTIECKRWLDENCHLSHETDQIIDHFKDLIVAVPNARFRIADEFDWNSQAGHTENSFRRTTPCEQPFYLLLIHQDGVISPCCLDSNQEISVGNIFEANTLREVLIGESLYNVRKKLLTLDFSDRDLCGACSMWSAVDNLLLQRNAEVLRIL